MSSLLYVFRPYFLFIVCLTVVFSTLGECRDDLELLPNDPSGEAGHNMRLLCRLNNEAVHWQNPVFTMAYYSRKKHHPIPATDVHHINHSTIEVILRNVTDKHHLATVFCRNENLTDSQIITVGHKPPVPKIIYYRYVEWQEFVFRWKIRPATNGFRTNYTAWFRSTNQPDFTPCKGASCFSADKSKCPAYQIDDRACHITEMNLNPARFDGYIYIKVNATNVAGSSTSETLKLFFYDYTDPGQVSELGVTSRLKENGAGLIDVVSFRPQRGLQVLIYEIVTKSLENPENERRISRNVQTLVKSDWVSIALEDLTPYTEYALSIRTAVEIIGRKKHTWGNWSNITFTSHEEVPLRSPAVCQCCFQVDEDSTNRTTLIYFKTLTKEESRGNASYELEYKSSDGSTRQQLNRTDSELSFLLNETQFIVKDNWRRERTNTVQWKESVVPVFRLTLPKGAQYKLNISAKTKAGHALTKSTVFIPKQSELLRLQPPANCSVMSVDDANENLIVFRWNMTPYNVTVFWCKAFLNKLKCQQPLNWKESDRGVASVNITLTESYEGYLFGIGQAFSSGNSTGIHWTCKYYKKDAVASPPLLASLETDETKVVMRVDKPIYNPKEGLVYGFNIYYSSAEEQGQQRELKVFVEDGRLAPIDGLKRGTSYKFKAETLTAAGPSYTNTSVYVVTLPFRLAEHAVGWVIFAGIVVGILALVGLSCCIRWPHEKWIKLRRWIKFEPCMPSVVLDEREEKQKSSSYPTYSVLSESEQRNNAHVKMSEQQLEEDGGGKGGDGDQFDPDGPDSQSEDVVQSYSWIAKPRKDFIRERRPSEEMDLLNNRLRHLVNVSQLEHVLPRLKLERVPNAPMIHRQPLLPDPAIQSSPSTNGTAIASDVHQTAQSDCYITHRTVENDFQSLTSYEQIGQYIMTDQVQPNDNQTVNSDSANRVFSKQYKLSTNDLPANDDEPQTQILLSSEDLVGEDMTRQKLPTRSQQARNSILPELGQDAEEVLSDRFCPVSSQGTNANVIETDRSRPTGTDRVLRSVDGSTLDGSEFNRPSVVLLSDEHDAVSDCCANSSEQMNQVSRHCDPSHSRILPRLLQDAGCAPNTSSTNLARPPEREERDEDETGVSDEAANSSIAEADGSSQDSSSFLPSSASSSSSSSSSPNAGQASPINDDGYMSVRANPCVPNSLDDDEGIYI